MSQSGLAGKFRQVYCLYCTRVTLISMEEGTLPRHFISTEEDTLLVCRKSTLVCVNPERGLNC